ncbi:hypothetical protein [Piscinibacter terrae]|nr:hypothetical protein [Albitalea terrae]
MSSRQKPQADPSQTVKDDEAEHRDKSPHEHPRSRKPSADSSQRDERSGSEGNLQPGSNDDEDARSRRRDIGP